MEIINKRLNGRMVAFLSKDQQWHFINNNTKFLGYDNGYILIDHSRIPIDEDTMQRVIEFLNSED